MMYVRDSIAEVEAALAKDGMSLEDYNATIFVVVGGVVMEDSIESTEAAQFAVDQALKYGEEDAFFFVWDGGEE